MADDTYSIASGGSLWAGRAPAAVQFASVVHQADTGGTVPTGAAQATHIYLHGSGGAVQTFGSTYKGYPQASGSYPENCVYGAMDHLAFAVRTMPADSDFFSGGQAYGQIEPWDNNGTYPGGATRQSYWMGYTADDFSGLRLYKERHLDMMLAWLEANYPHMSATKRSLGGQSMGAWGTISYGLRRASKFSALYANMPRLRYGLDGSGAGGNNVRVPHWPVGVQVYSPASSPTLDSADGTVNAASHLNAISYVSDTANAIPWLGWCIGRNDGYTPFQDHIDMVAAMRAAGRGFAFAWDNGGHTGTLMTQIMSSYYTGLFRTDQGYPIYTNNSGDQDPSVDLTGGINLGFQHRNVFESAGSWSCEIRNLLGARTVTVRPKSKVYAGPGTPQVVNVPAGSAWVTVSF